MVHKKGWFPVNELKNTEFTDTDRVLVDSAYELLDDPRSTAFFALLEPYYRRAHEIPMSTLIGLQQTGAPFGPLSRACEALVRLTGADGPLPNRASHYDMIELLFVLRAIGRIEIVLAAKSINAPGGAS
jgi:hypothetical protein